MPSTEDGIREFLASEAMKGIGRKTAAAIVSVFGTDTLRVIEEEPHRLTDVPGIGKKTAERISLAFGKHREFASIVLYLQQFGINAEYAMKLYRVYGSGTIEAVKEIQTGRGYFRRRIQKSGQDRRPDGRGKRR